MMLPFPQRGILHGVQGVEAARKVPSVVDVVVTAPLGREVIPLPEGDSYLGFFSQKGKHRKLSKSGCAKRMVACRSTYVRRSRLPQADERDEPMTVSSLLRLRGHRANLGGRRFSSTEPALCEPRHAPRVGREHAHVSVGNTCRREGESANPVHCLVRRYLGGEIPRRPPRPPVAATGPSVDPGGATRA